MKLEIQIALKEYGRLSDLSLDWYFVSCEQKGFDKKIAILYFEKAREERVAVAKRLNELTLRPTHIQP